MRSCRKSWKTRKAMWKRQSIRLRMLMTVETKQNNNSNNFRKRQKSRKRNSKVNTKNSIKTYNMTKGLRNSSKVSRKKKRFWKDWKHKQPKMNKL